MPMATKGTVVPNPFKPVMIDTVDREALFGGLISAGHTVEYARVQADTLPSTAGALQMLARHRLQVASELVEPWKNFDGPLPDYDHILRPVYESGIQYAVELLAKDLLVETYDLCDGTEEFDGDLGGTMFNIIREVMPIDADGEKMYPGDVRVAFAALTVEAQKLREALNLALLAGSNLYSQLDAHQQNTGIELEVDDQAVVDGALKDLEYANAIHFRPEDAALSTPSPIANAIAEAPRVDTIGHAEVLEAIEAEAAAPAAAFLRCYEHEIRDPDCATCASETDPSLVNSCRASLDGECGWSGCPQLRDNEPSATGRHCPLDIGCARCRRADDDCRC